MLDFLRTTVKQSPQDSRFAILLAQVDTTFDDLPAAVTAYSQAIAIRKDRADLYSARVDLELRLGVADPSQTEAAANDFQRLYILSYKDPAWMVRLAELRARQQRPTDAVKALEVAYVSGQPITPANYFSVADQLEKWSLLSEARTYAERGIKLAGPTLLTTSNYGGGSTYARVLARLGKPDEALNTLSAIFRTIDADSSLPADVLSGMTKAGMSARDIEQTRPSYVQQRRQTARQQLDQAIRAIGEVVQTDYTPEQKVAYQQTLEKLNADHLNGTNQSLALEAASSAGLAEVEAEWHKQMLLNAPLPQGTNTYESLERRRLRLTELGNTLELYATRVAPKTRNSVLRLAAQAYRDSGDEANEIRLTRPLAMAHDSGLLDRYLDLLLRRDRTTLVALAGNSNDEIADAAANYTVAHATQAQALSAVSNRARKLPAVWGPATASLVVTNFASPTTSGAVTTLPYFLQSLRYDDSVATRLAKPFRTDHELTGDDWFSYASRFGIFLATVPRAATLPDSEDFLAAELERAPSAVAAYLHLARNYADAGNYTASIVQYEHVLELAPNNPAVHDEFAVVLYRASRRDEATAHWRTALTLMAKRQTGETFFTAFKSITQHLQQRSLFATLRPEVETVLRAYLKTNGNYRSNEVLQDVFTASASPTDGLNLILSLSTAAADPELILSDLNNASWLSPSARQSILLHRLDIARNAPAPVPNPDVPAPFDRVRSIQLLLLQSYLSQQQDTQAQAVIDSIPARDRNVYAVQLARIELAAHTGRLVSVIDGYRASPESAPSLEVLATAADQLTAPQGSRKPEPTAARDLREFIFSQKQLAHSLVPTDFLSLAQSRIDTDDMPGSLELLHRLTLQAGSDPYSNTDSAAALLVAANHSSEAIPFLGALVQSVPWNSSYRLRLAEAQMKTPDGVKAVNDLVLIGNDSRAPYSVRVQAAQDFQELTQQATASPLATVARFNSGELNYIASDQRTVAAARQPFFTAARIAAASASATAKPDRIALLREAIAIAPNGPAADHARLGLLLTYTATDSSSATLALYSQLLNQPTQSSELASEADTDAPATDSEDEIPAIDTESSPGPMFFPAPAVSALDRAAQIRLAVLLASAFNREHNTAQSLFYDQLAVNIDAQNPKPDPVVVKRLADYEATLALEQKNAARRPLIHSDLSQPNQVRPRLTLADQARAETP